MKSWLCDMWRRHSLPISQGLLGASVALNVGVALITPNYWLQALDWFFAGLCAGAIMMNHLTHYFLARYRHLQALMDARMEVHADQVGKVIAEHLHSLGVASVEPKQPGITRH